MMEDNFLIKKLTKTMYWNVETVSLLTFNGEKLQDIFSYFYPRQIKALLDNPSRAKGMLDRNGNMILLVKIGGDYGYPSFPEGIDWTAISYSQDAMSVVDNVILDIQNQIYEESGLRPNEYHITSITPVMEEGPINKGFVYKYKAEIKVKGDY